MRRRLMLIAVVVLSGLAIVLWLAPLSLKGNTKAQSFFSQGNRLAERGDYDMAAAEWEQAVRTDPKLIEGWVLLGEYYFGRERFDEFVRDPFVHDHPLGRHTDLTIVHERPKG